MKPIFGIDVTNDKNSELTYSDLFKTKSLSEATLKDLDSRRDDLNTTVEKAKLPGVLTLVMYLGLLWGLIVVGGLFKADVGIEQAIRNAPILVFTGVAALIVSGVLFIIGRIKNKKVMNEENADEQLEALDNVADRAFAELEIPSGAILTDVLLFKYTIKDGVIKPKTGALDVSAYINFEMRAYLRDFNLCLADVENVYSFPLESLRRITTVKKRITVPNWNKEEDYNKGIYKQYKIGANQYGYSVKPYHILELERDGEVYGIYFPSYELPTFESLTLLRAENPDANDNTEE